MSKEKQFHIEPGVISKLPWVVDTIPYAYHNTSDVMNFGILYELQKEKYDKIKQLLKGKEHEITSKDLVYVLPMHPTPLFKIKEYCKQLGCKITNDITKATAVLGHDNVVNSGFAYNQLLYCTDLEAPYLFESEHLDISSLKQQPIFKSSFTEKYKYEEVVHFLASVDTISYLSGHRSVSAYKAGKYNRELQMEKVWYGGKSRVYCQPYTVDLIYNILAKKLPVVSSKSFNFQFKKSTVIDKELYETLLKMFKGSTDDQTMAVNILVNCDVSPSIFYLMELAGDWSVRNIVYAHSKFKHVREFIDTSEFNSFSGMTSYRKFDTLVKHNQLSSEQFVHFYKKSKENLKDRIETAFANSFLSEMFQVKVSINQEYLEHLEKLGITQEEMAISNLSDPYENIERSIKALDIIKELQHESVTTT